MKLNRLALFFTVLSLSMAACRPVFAIGWGEILILTTLIIILLGPLLLRLYRFWQKEDPIKKKDEDKKK